MHRRYNLAGLILAVVVALVLTPLIAGAAPRAQIAFSSERDGNFEIYVMDIDGRNQRRLTNNRRDDWEPSWSPGGKRIAFTSSEDRNSHEDVEGKRPHIYVMEADGKNRRKLTKNPFAEWDPSWSPDGKQIAFTGKAALHAHRYVYVVDAEGKNLRKLGSDHEEIGWEPSWSPDGKHIAFVSTREKNGWRYDIFVMDADGSNHRQLTNNDAWNFSPSWSPDGERIAFVSTGDWKNYEIYVMDADGENLRRLTRNPAPDLHPSWSPDGEHIVFVSHRDGNYEIYAMNADGARQVRRRTKDGSEDTDPAWFDPAFAVEIAPFAVAPVGKKITMWGWLKQVDR